MRLGQIRVLGGDYDDAVPEILVALVISQPFGDDVGLADVAPGVLDCRLFLTEQQIRASALHLVTLEQVGQI